MAHIESKRVYDPNTATTTTTTKIHSKVSFKGGFNTGLSIVKIVFILLLCFSVFSSLLGSEKVFRFGDLLGLIEDLPEFPDLQEVLQVISIPTILEDWDAFNFLRDFLNSITGVINTAISFVGFIGTGLVQVLAFVTYIFTKL